MKTHRKPTQETLENWHNDPNNWILGIFYFNKDDKRIFPPKRSKLMGWTVNFANPISLLSLIGLIAIVIMVSRYFKVH